MNKTHAVIDLPGSSLSAIVPIVLMEDAPVHTDENGYVCGDPTCPCAEDSLAGAGLAFLAQLTND